MAHALLAYYSVRLPKNQYPYVSMHTVFVHSDEKSDYAIRTPELCGIALMRHDSDYDDYIPIDKEDLDDMIPKVKKMINDIQNYLEPIYGEEDNDTE